MKVLPFVALIVAALVAGAARAEDCGCVGETTTFAWGSEITESCVLNCDLVIPPGATVNCFTVGTDNITIDGNGHSITANRYYYGIDVTGRADVTITDITIDNFSYGIWIDNSDRVEVSDSEIVDCRWWRGIAVRDSRDCAITGNFLQGNGGSPSTGLTGGHAIRVLASERTVISHNTVNENDYGIRIGSDSSDTLVSGNTVIGNSYGIVIDDGSGNFLDGNRACANWGYDTGYDIRDFSGAASGENNSCENADRYNDLEAVGCAFSCAPPIGDYNGDGTSDLALFRPSSGLWLIRGLTRVYFGSSTDQPVPQDYSGNGAWDVAVYRSSQSKWMARGVTTAWFGAMVDTPVPADYDGDGTADCAVFRPSIGKWAVRGVTQAYYGLSSDSLVPGNYAGDPRAQIAVYRPATGRWLVKGLTALYFGGPTDSAVPGPYSGGLSWDYAVFRHNQGKWLVRGLTQVYYGNSTDTVQGADYDGDGTFDFGVFRSSTGRWLIRGVTSAYFGAASDEPVTNP